MLELGHAELELLVVVPSDQAKLAEQAVQAIARPLRCPLSVSAPPHYGILQQRPSLITSHAAALRQLVGEGLHAIGRESYGADAGEQKPLYELARRALH